MTGCVSRARPSSEPMLTYCLGTNFINTLRPRQTGRLFANDTFKRIFLNENIGISTRNLLKSVPTGLIDNISALVLIMAWRRPGDKPLSEPMLVKSLTHICITGPQWVKIRIKMHQFSFMKIKLKMWYARWQPFCTPMKPNYNTGIHDRNTEMYLRLQNML